MSVSGGPRGLSADVGDEGVQDEGVRLEEVPGPVLEPQSPHGARGGGGRVWRRGGLGPPGGRGAVVAGTTCPPYTIVGERFLLYVTARRDPAGPPWSPDLRLAHLPRHRRGRR